MITGLVHARDSPSCWGMCYPTCGSKYFVVNSATVSCQVSTQRSFLSWRMPIVVQSIKCTKIGMTVTFNTVMSWNLICTANF